MVAYISNYDQIKGVLIDPHIIAFLPNELMLYARKRGSIEL